ncbi:MAG: hypothetical protein NE330_10965 [Lentisphaeraceae bacterium]|nr:hypothetical protein [Lentisphaeraceae bacterium]
MKNYFFTFLFLFTIQSYALEKILEDNLDVLEYCLIKHFKLSEESAELSSYYESCHDSILLSSAKKDLRNTLMDSYISDESFLKYVLRDYLYKERLLDYEATLMYKVAELSKFEGLLSAYSDRLISKKSITRFDTEVPHFNGGNESLEFKITRHTFIWDGESFEITVADSEENHISTITTIKYFDELRHGLHSLMFLGRLQPVKIGLKHTGKGSISTSIDPNYLFQQLYSMIRGKKFTLTMLGDIDSQGNYKSYGYLRYGYSCKDKSDLFLVSDQCVDQLLELVKVETLQVVIKNTFLSASSLKGAIVTLEDLKAVEASKIEFKRAVRNINSRSKWPTLIKNLDIILKKNPSFLSALIVKKVLQGEVESKLTFKSSYNEFNLFFRMLDEGYASSARELNDLQVEIKKIQKVSHSKFSSMLTMCDDIASDKLKLLKIPKPKPSTGKGTTLRKKASEWRNINQRMYKNIRIVRHLRDSMLDKQSVLETIFKR